jgi:hypothetical protein
MNGNTKCYTVYRDSQGNIQRKRCTLPFTMTDGDATAAYKVHRGLGANVAVAEYETFLQMLKVYDPK